jgi:hypothetical protein
MKKYKKKGQNETGSAEHADLSCAVGRTHRPSRHILPAAHGTLRCGRSDVKADQR